MCYDRIAAATAEQLAKNWDNDLNQAVYVESLKPALKLFREQETADFYNRVDDVVDRAGIFISKEISRVGYCEDEYETGFWYWESPRFKYVSDTFSTRDGAVDDAFQWLDRNGRIEGECECCKAFVLSSWGGSVTESGIYCSEACAEGK